MTFTIQDIQALRQKTGAGMMDCKKALTEAKGSIEQAENVLRERGMVAVSKKAERVSADGVAFADIIDGKAVLLEINTETDFAAKSEAFLEFVRDVATVIAGRQPTDVESLLQCRVGGKDLTVQEALQEKVLVYGEKIQIRRFELFYGGALYAYMHNNGRVGVIIQINTESGENENLTDICKELSLQVASMNPEFIERGDISKDRYDALFAGFEDELQNDPKYSNKPKALRDRILNGKIEKFCREKCLLEQPYIKEESITVGKFLELRSKVIGFELKVNAFARYEKGEGLLPEGEKSSEAYALELAGKGK